MADSINRRFSWHSVAGSIRNCIHRFPLSVLYVVALTTWAIILVWTDDYSDEWLRICNVITYGLSAGALLSLTVYLWREGTGRKMAAAGPQLIVNLLLIADCVWLYMTYTTIGPAIILGHTAVITAMGVCVFSGAFTNTRSDIPCWNFSYSLIMSAIVSAGIGIVMTIAVSAIFATMNALLDFDEHNWWISVWLTAAIMIPVLIFMGRIPTDDIITRNEASPSRFLTAIAKFLFVPTVVVFYGVLYIYLAKIISNWQLPEGMVCWPVTGAIVACIVIEYLLYPVRMATGAKARFENGVARWLPLTLIPLLGLMTVSLIHRVNEYGLTLSRLYMITFNAWAYA
ncbi:MAG: DUF4153 domain-containing protein, partial [Muribaculaceae bacterium]|nr:DUF4153 domain-containing protein [Muribaculaceae bacterium]